MTTAAGAAHTDPACAAARGAPLPAGPHRRVVAVFASPVAQHLLHFARDTGFATVLLEPEPGRVPDPQMYGAVADDLSAAAIDDATDVVVTDHDRADLGPVLRDVLAARPRWVGVMGSLRHTAPHVAALRDLGVPDDVVATIHRPIGLDIGSRTPPEIAIATLAGLIADRTGRCGGFGFAQAKGTVSGRDGC